MSKFFGIHFGMHDDAGRLHQWVPGDEVPGWAADRVGDHCLASDVVPEVHDSDTTAEPPAAPVADVPESGTPDFTKPVPAKRGRPSKAE